MYCATKYFLELKFPGPHNKLHGVLGLGNYYHMSFDTKLGHVSYAIRHIPCAFNSCTYSLDQPWIAGFPEQKQPRCQTIEDFTYCPVLGSFNNWNSIKISHKETSSEEIYKIHQVVLDSMIKNMAELIQTGQCDAINTTYTSTMGYYVIEFMSEPYKLQE